MCGFAGVISWDEKYRMSRDTLAKMSARIAHRGPDGEGAYFSPDAEITPDRPQVALAHRRLAILDPDPRANQPFTDKAGRWLVYNGEIYNFRELRAELSKLQPSYEWRTNCDTEVLLIAYDQWGEKCVEHFNGMFAFAIWDEPKKSLFLARDRMGQKPLYYSYASDESGQAIAFASEWSALKELSWVPRKLSEADLIHFLRFGYVLGFNQVRPASVMVLQGSRRNAEHRRYFQHSARGPLEKEWAHQSASALITETRRFVEQAVSRQLVSDVPLGCFLSGGVDSSIIAACMRASMPADRAVMTFSIGFDDPRYDESSYAAAVAKHLGTTHHEFRVRANVADDLLKLAAVFGEPFADSSALPTHYLAREARQHVKVALSGDGGDELFGGYDRYRAIALTERFHAMPAPLKQMLFAKLSQRAISLIPGTHPKSVSARLKRLVATAPLAAAQRYASYMEIFDLASVRDLLGREIRLPKGHFGTAAGYSFEKYFRGRDVVQAAMATDRETYLPDDLLTKVDRASMLHALEIRSPFMDQQLVRFASSLSTEHLIGGGPKRMLREAFAQDLPAWVFKRKKMGFAVPIGDWFRGELRPMLRDHLFAANSFAASHFNRPVVERLVDEHETGRRDHSQRLYALLMLELWWTTSGSPSGTGF